MRPIVCDHYTYGFYRSGSVLTPITGLFLSNTLLATSSMVPSPKVEKENMKLSGGENAAAKEK